MFSVRNCVAKAELCHGHTGLAGTGQEWEHLDIPELHPTRDCLSPAIEEGVGLKNKTCNSQK